MIQYERSYKTLTVLTLIKDDNSVCKVFRFGKIYNCYIFYD